MTTKTGASESISPTSTNEQDIREVDNAYALSTTDATGWTFSSPMSVTEDPSGLARNTISRYDSTGVCCIEPSPRRPAGRSAA
jgi:hypothetical protein